MVRLNIIAVVLMVLVACSPMSASKRGDTTATPTISPTVTLQADPTEITPLETVNPAVVNQIDTNQPYTLDAIFLQSGLRLRIRKPLSSQDEVIEYELSDTIESEAQYPLYASTAQFDSDWLGMYLLHPINTRLAHAQYPIPEIDGMFVISTDRDKLAVGECLVSGGRGQWCGKSSLWIFDLTTGFYEKFPIDLRWLYNLQFSDDDTQIIAEGCLEQPNAYFGWCGDSAIITLDVSDGTEIDRIVMTATP